MEESYAKMEVPVIKELVLAQHTVLVNSVKHAVVSKIMITKLRTNT